MTSLGLETGGHSNKRQTLVKLMQQLAEIDCVPEMAYVPLGAGACGTSLAWKPRAVTVAPPSPRA
jgi:hypothetical protein